MWSGRALPFESALRKILLVPKDEVKKASKAQPKPKKPRKKADGK